MVLLNVVPFGIVIVVCTELPVGTRYAFTWTPSPMKELPIGKVVTAGATPASAVATNATQPEVLPASAVGQVMLTPGTMNVTGLAAGHGAMPTRVYCQVLVPELSSATYSVGSALATEPRWFGTVISACANRNVR